MAANAEKPAAFDPKITAFVCNWCTYTGADLAGTSRLQMADNVRIIRLPCTGRIDALFVLKAFERGADGVIVSGCHPADCHYTAGNYHARRRFALLLELLEFLGVEPGRLTFSWVSASEGGKWRDIVNSTTERVRALGPFDAYRRLASPAPAFAAQVAASPPPPAASAAVGDGRATAELREAARAILADGRAGVVIGWEEGPHGVRPAFVTRPDDVDRLLFDERCVHNLAAYLSPRRTHLAALGRPAIVVKPCDAKAVAGLIRETQVKREDLVLLGVRCPGVAAGPERHVDLSGDTVSPRCAHCVDREPHLADQVVGPPVPTQATSTRPDMVARLEGMTPAERWSFWQGALARCTRCNACRQVCPLCTCERCAADKTVPQWIESSPHGRGNLAWHVTRALHLAGRCVGCGECTRACPAGIPLGLLNRKLANVVHARYGYRPSDDPQAPAPIGRFELSDSQEFIL